MQYLTTGKYCTPEEYMAICGYRRLNSVYRAIRSGRLPAKKFGNRWMISEAALVIDRRMKSGKYINSRRKTADLKKLLLENIAAAGYSYEDVFREEGDE